MCAVYTLVYKLYKIYITHTHTTFIDRVEMPRAQTKLTGGSDDTRPHARATRTNNLARFRSPYIVNLEKKKFKLKQKENFFLYINRADYAFFRYRNPYIYAQLTALPPPPPPYIIRNV